MKKVVLVIDHKDRDLRGVVLIAFWLNAKYGVLPYLTHTKNEISSLIKHKPDLILVQHVRHHHQREFLHFARSQKTAIAVSLAEGFPLTNEQYLFQVGRDEYIKLINLFLTWGRRFNESISKDSLTKDSVSITVGSPRFDYHTPRFKAVNMCKDDFCKALKIEKKKPIISWMTNSIYANPVNGYEEFIKVMKDLNTSDSRIAHMIEPLARDHQRVFDLISSYFEKLLKAFPDISFIIKVHPAEREEVYQDKFRNYPNLRIVSGAKTPISPIIMYADIQLNWRCTTSSEAWIRSINSKTISVEPEDIELNDYFRYLNSGNDVVSDYSSLYKKINYYLNGGEVSQDLIHRRQKFIRDYLFAGDGCSAERCAEVIYNYISKRKTPRWNIYNYKIFIKYFRHYRFKKEWLVSKRDRNHPKYIPQELIHEEMGNLMKLFNTRVKYVVEM